MIYVSVPGDYTDIDGYASALTYAELLNKLGTPAKTFLTGDMNYSVPEELRILELENYDVAINPDDEFIVVDLSISAIISKHIPESQITEVIDHHVGFEEYWQERIGDKSTIEKIGAVATIIAERYDEYLGYDKMRPGTAKLLLAAILDNTLNFNADITTERDKIAAEKLSKIIGISVSGFADWYFKTVSNTIISDLQKAINNDHKPFHIPKLDIDIECAQITLWDGKLIKNKSDIISETMNKVSDNWLCSVISISDRRNYILTNNESIGEYLSEILSLKPENEWYVSNHLWLRKEIFAKIRGL